MFFVHSNLPPSSYTSKRFIVHEETCFIIAIYKSIYFCLLGYDRSLTLPLKLWALQFALGVTKKPFTRLCAHLLFHNCRPAKFIEFRVVFNLCKVYYEIKNDFFIITLKQGFYFCLFFLKISILRCS
jgi:hypothetical protein